MATKRGTFLNGKINVLKRATKKAIFAKLWATFWPIHLVTLIGLSIRFEKWILIWNVNQIFVMDLDWINHPKIWIEQWPTCT